MPRIGAVGLTCALMLSVSVATAQLRVVSTGDSITNGYGAHRLQYAIATHGLDAEVIRIASGGASTARYLGQEDDPVEGVPVDYVERVLDADPDVILLKLGTNDALRAARDPNWLTNYFDNYRSIVERYRTADAAPLVVISTLIPIVSPDHQAAAELIDTQINPWLRALAIEYGIPLIDLHDQIQQHDDWTAWYNDGIHLWANNAHGYWWMAERFSSVLPKLTDPNACVCIGDYDCSGRIDLADLAHIIGTFGGGEAGDLNFDDKTDLIDLQMLLSRYGMRCN